MVAYYPNSSARKVVRVKVHHVRAEFLVFHKLRNSVSVKAMYHSVAKYSVHFLVPKYSVHFTDMMN